MITRAQMIWLAALVVGDILLGVVCYGLLPERSPIHWDIHGQVDGYGAPWEVALTFPVIVAVMAGVLLGVAQIPQVATALARSGPIYGRMVIAGIAMGVLIHALILLNALGKPIDVSRGIFVAFGLLFAVLGNRMGKLRRNQVAGIRTPWTLKSDVVWERTHRIGGRFMVALGLAILLAALVFPFWAALIVQTVGVVALVVWAFVYSRSIYQTVHEKEYVA